MNKVKNKSNKQKTEKNEINKQEVGYTGYACKTCAEQCAGHGGGTASFLGGCICNDGIYLECLIEE